MTHSPAKYAKAQCRTATVHPTTADLAWAAGFMEGEASFASATAKLRNGVAKKYARLALFQNNQEPIERLQAMFGGSIRRMKQPRGREVGGLWSVNGARARGVMLTMFSFLSARRREQVRVALTGGY